jgi:spermidine synthase
MTELEKYWKRLYELPGIVKRPELAKLEALKESGSRVLVEERTDFQRVLLVETPKKELMLLLDGEIQFYSGDEHRFHESLALVPFLYRRAPMRRVGVMGGGDGLIARELLGRYGDEVERITIVDIDPAVTEMAKTVPQLVELSEGSLLDGRVEVVSVDALTYVTDEPFDLILCDLPDPTSPILGRLYNQEFYRHLRSQLSPEGLLAVQIIYVPPLFDGVHATLNSVFPAVEAYAVWMYSFVRAGFGICGRRPLERRHGLPEGTRHLTPQALDQMFYFAPDEPRAEVSEVSTDENMKVLEWYETFLRDYFEERILYY